MSLANKLAEVCNDTKRPEVLSLHDEDKCPSEFLPYLASSFGIPFWFESWSEQQKRQIIAEYPKLALKAGTVPALKRVIKFCGFPGARIAEKKADGLLMRRNEEGLFFEVQIAKALGEPIDPQHTQALERILPWFTPAYVVAHIVFTTKIPFAVQIKSGVQVTFTLEVGGEEMQITNYGLGLLGEEGDAGVLSRVELSNVGVVDGKMDNIEHIVDPPAEAQVVAVADSQWSGNTLVLNAIFEAGTFDAKSVFVLDQHGKVFAVGVFDTPEIKKTERSNVVLSVHLAFESRTSVVSSPVSERRLELNLDAVRAEHLAEVQALRNEVDRLSQRLEKMELA